MMTEEYRDILPQLQEYVIGMEAGPQKALVAEAVNEIMSLRSALQIFSDEFERLDSEVH